MTDHEKRIREALAEGSCLVTMPELRALLADLEAMRADAERYRWLRDSHESNWAICEWADDRDGRGFYRDARNGDIVEKAIDAEMAAERALKGAEA